MKDFDKQALYKIFNTRDARYDGRFFVGVKTTGIYCRPICPAKAKEENCVYFDSQAAAEKAGFRPCLLCRPELAPGCAPIDAKKNIADIAKVLLEEKMNSRTAIDDVCRVIGCSSRHLRRVFQEEYGVSPIEYIQTCRLLLAKKLLTDTNLTVADVAFASGFGSVKRFHTLFKEKYHLTPGNFRKSASKKAPHDIIVKIGYKKPFRYEDLLRFFEERTIHGVERVENGQYIRSIQARKDGKSHKGIIRISNDEKKGCINLAITHSLLPVLPEIIAKIKNMFDIYAEPEVIYENIKSINTIIPGAFLKGTRIPGSADDFEICVRAILGQLVSVKAARTTLGKFAEAFGEKTDQEQEGFLLFPTYDKFLCPESEIAGMLGPLGITKTKARAIWGAANYLRTKDAEFSECLDPAAEIKNLMEIKGIGKWTAQYISMRAMKNTNILLDTDHAVKKIIAEFPALGETKLTDRWNPWKTYVTIGLWNSLSREE